MIRRIFSLGIKAEVLQLTFTAGAIVGMLTEAVMMVAVMSGFPLARMIGGLL